MNHDVEAEKLKKFIERLNARFMLGYSLEKSLREEESSTDRALKALGGLFVVLAILAIPTIIGTLFSKFL